MESARKNTTGADRAASRDATARFSDRVRDYVRWRPGYPHALLNALEREAGLSERSVVADVGSGTGISSELLLESGCTVFAVEPNADMRMAAEAKLGDHPRFRSVAGTAEATNLPGGRVDLISAGQAFHWFDPKAARAEFTRILRPGGHIALFWNTRDVEATAFLRAYEALLQAFGTDYDAVDHRRVGPEHLKRFFRGPYLTFTFPNEQVLDFDGLKGRLLSSSYTPAPGHPQHAPMLEDLYRIFETHEVAGSVRLLYVTELHVGT